MGNGEGRIGEWKRRNGRRGRERRRKEGEITLSQYVRKAVSLWTPIHTSSQLK